MAARTRRGRLIGLVLGSAALVLTPVMAGAAPLTPSQTFKPIGYFRFCAEAQLDIANIDEGVMASRGISVGGSIYDDVNDFTLSKSSVDLETNRLLISQWTEYSDAEKTKARQVRCKLRTGESLNKGAWPEDDELQGIGKWAVDRAYGLGSLADGVSTNPVDQTCTVVNQRTIDNVWQSIADASQTPIYPKPTTNPDVLTVSGPAWLSNATAPLTLDAGALTVTSRALVVPADGASSGYISGAHYCTLVAPTYLRDVLLGTSPVV